MNNVLPLIPCIIGPTASGKTELALKFAKEQSVEIISLDSAMVYRTMDIGTAKPTKKEQAEIPHHLIDICDPLDTYSVGAFYRDIAKLIPEILNRGNTPLLVGGTMLYVNTLRNGLSTLPQANKTIRDRIQQEANQIGWRELHKQLEAIDLDAAKRIHENDAQRIQRALELYQLTGQTPTSLYANETMQKLPFRFEWTVLRQDVARLRERIQARFETMLEMGFEQEVEALYHRGDLHADLPAIRSVGYRQMWGYINHEYDFAHMKTLTINATCQLAKRQRTWLRRWSDV